MEENNTPTWTHRITGVDGNTRLFGVNMFDYKWVSTPEKVKVTDSRYHREHVFPVYKVTIDGVEHTFAAGEFSNSVWGFFTPEY